MDREGGTGCGQVIARPCTCPVSSRKRPYLAHGTVGRVSSPASAFPGDFTQPLYVTHRGQAEQALVLSVEVGDVEIAYVKGSVRRVETLVQQHAAGLQEPQPLLELHWTQCCDRLELVM